MAAGESVTTHSQQVVEQFNQAYDEALRRRSHMIQSPSRVTAFLYELMRDRVPPGVVETVLRNSLDTPTHFTNGYLAEYADDVAHRLEHGSNDTLSENNTE